jgi:hypothetical protein
MPKIQAENSGGKIAAEICCGKFLRVSNFLRPHKFSPFPVKNQKFYLGF